MDASGAEWMMPPLKQKANLGSQDIHGIWVGTKGRQWPHTLHLLGNVTKRTADIWVLRAPCNVAERKPWPTRADTRVPPETRLPKDPCMDQTYTEEGKVCHFVENKAQPHRPLSLRRKNASDLGEKHQEFEQTFVKTFWFVCQDVTGSLPEKKKKHVMLSSWNLFKFGEHRSL